MNRTTIKALIAAEERRAKATRAAREHAEKREDPDEATTAYIAEVKEAEQASAELRAALEKELEAADEKAGDPKWRAQLDRIECRHYLEAAALERPLKGLEAEVNEELGLESRMMPWDALLSDKDRIELRQDVATVVDAAAKGKPRQAVVPRVFRRSDAAWCEIMMPTAPRGLPVYPVLTGGVSGSTAAEGAAVDSEAATFTGTMIEPTRTSAAYTLRAEQMAQFADLESVLRADLRMAMGKLLDDSIVSADATGANPGSIISHATGAPAANPAAKATLADFDTVFADVIDGLYAYDRRGGKLLIGVETQKFLEVERHAEIATTFKSLLTAEGSMFRATSRVAAPAADVQKAYRFVPNELRAYAPIWEGLEFIRDPYTGAAKGETRLTAIMLFGFDITRGAVTERRFKLA